MSNPEPITDVEIEELERACRSQPFAQWAQPKLDALITRLRRAEARVKELEAGLRETDTPESETKDV